MRVGLLAGSFNPAHAGHRHVARLALTRLALDQVWLMVSPGNPLKDERGMAPLAERLASARDIADGHRIVATAIETAWGTRFTLDALHRLRAHFPRARFVLIVGADLLAQLPRWRRWRDIVRAVPIVVLPRPGYTHPALAAQASRALAGSRLPARAATTLASAAPPAWMFLPAPEHDASATAIRARRQRPHQGSRA